MICDTCQHYVKGKCMNFTNLPGYPSAKEFMKDDTCMQYRSRPYVRLKPPLGCAPYYVRNSERIKELCEAIERYAGRAEDHDRIKLWVAEINYLNEMDRFLRRIENEKTWTENKDGRLEEVK